MSVQVGITVMQFLKYLHTTVGSPFDNDVKLFTSLHESLCRDAFTSGWQCAVNVNTSCKSHLLAMQDFEA